MKCYSVSDRYMFVYKLGLLLFILVEFLPFVLLSVMPVEVRSHTLLFLAWLGASVYALYVYISRIQRVRQEGMTITLHGNSIEIADMAGKVRVIHIADVQSCDCVGRIHLKSSEIVDVQMLNYPYVFRVVREIRSMLHGDAISGMETKSGD